MATTFPLRAMADLGRVLEAPDADFGHWVTPPPKDGVLSLEIERGPTLTAIPTSQSKFLAQGVAVEFLVPDAKGIVNEVVVTIVEGEIKGVRIK